MSLVDFLYHGEANVFQDNLDSFLGMAEEFQLKGLDKMKEEPVEQVPKESKRKISQSATLKKNQIASFKDNTPTQGLQSIFDPIPITETADVLNNFSGCTDLNELDAKVKSMMASSEYRIGKEQGRARICMVCGKEGHMKDILDHIEANHINHISIPCNICGKISKSRPALKMHKRRYHSA